MTTKMPAKQNKAKQTNDGVYCWWFAAGVICMKQANNHTKIMITD